MKPQKFSKSYKCDCFQPNNYCNCTDKSISSAVFMENVIDIAKSLIEVMNLCGIFKQNTKAITNVIIYYFLHFDEIVHRIDSIPKKRLNKENLMYDLGRKCLLKRVEAQMAYSIIKRAFKAFYHGTGLGGVPNNQLNNELAHTSECLWVHAAQRTAQIYASYEGLFYAFQKNLEYKIKFIYKQLYDRLSHRSLPSDDHECICINCVKRITRENLKKARVTTGMHVVDDPYEAAYLKEQEKELEKQAFEKCIAATESTCGTTSRGKTQCNCSSLKMTKEENVYQENANSIQNDSSQGPFECRWMTISKEEFEADESGIDIKQSYVFPCFPSDPDIECDTGCECTSEEMVCESHTEMECDEGVEAE